MIDKITKYVLIILITSLGLSCGNINSQNCSPIAQKYLDEVIDVLRNNSVNKNTIDWEDFSKDIYRHANKAMSVEDTYPSIEYAIAMLEDHHSYFMANSVSQDWNGSGYLSSHDVSALVPKISSLAMVRLKNIGSSTASLNVRDTIFNAYSNIPVYSIPLNTEATYYCPISTDQKFYMDRGSNQSFEYQVSGFYINDM